MHLRSALLSRALSKRGDAHETIHRQILVTSPRRPAAHWPRRLTGGCRERQSSSQGTATDIHRCSRSSETLSGSRVFGRARFTRPRSVGVICPADESRPHLGLRVPRPSYTDQRLEGRAAGVPFDTASRRLSAPASLRSDPRRPRLPRGWLLGQGARARPTHGRPLREADRRLRGER